MKMAFYAIFILFLSVTISVVVGTDAMAQTAGNKSPKPLFVTPYKPSVPTYESGVPMVAKDRSSNKKRASTTLAGPFLHDATNQFRPDVGRITSQRSFYDEKTDKSYRQYDYMSLLASRGETAKLKQVVADVRSNGVFDPDKYKEAVAAGMGKSKDQAKGEPVLKKEAGAAVARRSYVAKSDDSELPQKIHRGYDEDAQNQPAQQNPSAKKPIFLHR